MLDKEYEGIKDIHFWLDKANNQAPSKDLSQLYKSLIQEEYLEFMETQDGSPEQFNEIMDLIWVIVGFCYYQGYDIDKGLSLLFKANLTKLYDNQGNEYKLFNKQGKVLKTEFYKKPDFSSIMK